MAIRFVHTSDVHLDTCFAAGLGNRLRQAVRDTFRGVIQDAVAWDADAVLIAGDLFEGQRVTRDTVAFLRHLFQEVAPLPILIAPGNHDPYIDTSPYASAAWPDNVHIFSRCAWDTFVVADDAVAVHGFAFDGPTVSQNPFGALTIPDDERIHVAVAHGSEQGHQPPEQKVYAPFEAEIVAQQDLRYLALGHFHRYTEIMTSSTTMMYPGAPEALSFKNPEPAGHLRVEIEPDNVLIHRQPGGRVIFTTHTVDCTSFVSSHELLEVIRTFALNDERLQLTRVRLEGFCAENIQRELAAVRDAVADNFLSIELLDETQPSEDYEALAREATSLGAFMQRINDQLRDAAPEQRPHLERVRTVGLAAFRGWSPPIRGLEREQL